MSAEKVKTGTQTDLIHGPIFQSMVLFALPILVSEIFQQLYNTMDTVIIGHALGEKALAAAVIAVGTFFIMAFAASYLIGWVSGSKETVILQNGSLYLKVSTLFFLMLGIVVSTQYALQGIGQKVRPLLASAIELTGKILFAVFLVPHFGYRAVIFCEPFL